MCWGGGGFGGVLRRWRSGAEISSAEKIGVLDTCKDSPRETRAVLHMLDFFGGSSNCLR
ncbi:hypothetical protein HMPREF3192_00239 [Atopobium deltae]|uniref:Uncharacterized protein n=1 Tax=Atopobium deltae TaxID=1393034 RepID=A0A133XWR0_9ACTN|nr:hypothetical protein HMPREF3192_00239 [Atopobium deltae]